MTITAKSGGGRPKGYHNAKGDRLPSVTTVLGRFKESGALMQWAFKQGQSGAASLYEKTQKAADVGSYVHDVVEADILGAERPSMYPREFTPEQVKQAESAISSWEEWRSKSGLSVIHTELPLVSEIHQFGGTIDAVARDGDKIVLLDWKTSGGVYADYLLQLAAYALLWGEHNSDHIAGFHLVRFSKEGGDLEHRQWRELDEAREMFLLLRRAYELDLQLKKRV